MVEVNDFKDDPLEKKGWQRRCILDESRLSEVVKMYEELGLEVLVKEIEPGNMKSSESCTECEIGKLKVVYTRPKKVKENR